MDIFCSSCIKQKCSECMHQTGNIIKQEEIAKIQKQIILIQVYEQFLNKRMILITLTICVLQHICYYGVNAQNVVNNMLDSFQNFQNFTMTGNLELNQNTNLIMDYNEQAYNKISNYFINLDITKQSESIFLCICLANDCRKEIPLWDFNRLVELSKKTGGGNGKQIIIDIKNSPIICNVENYYHTSTEKQLYLNISSLIASYYKQNNLLGIFVRSKSNISGQYSLNLQSKRNFCHRCQNVVSCDKDKLTCQCEVGTMGQYCTENAIIFKLGEGSQEQMSNSFEAKKDVFFKKISLEPISSTTRFLKSSFKQNNFDQHNLSSHSRLLSDDASTIKSISKSNQFIYLQISQLVQQSGQSMNQTQSEEKQFFFHFKKNPNDSFKIYIADKFQINSNYISQNDFVKEIVFPPDQTDMYIQALTSNKDESSQFQENSTNIEKQLDDDSQTKYYTVQLKYDNMNLQTYQFLIVNQCISDNKLCTNEIDIQYSLKNLVSQDEDVESSNKIYLIVFLSLTVAGFILFCSYVIYKKKRNAKIKKSQSILKEKKQSSELQFQKIRDQVDADIAKDSSKIKDLSLKRDFDSMNINQEQNQKSKIYGGENSENASSNKILQNKQLKKLSVNKSSSGSVNKSISGSFNNDQYKYQHGRHYKQDSVGKVDYISQTSGDNYLKNNRKNSSQDIKVKQLYPTSSLFANEKEKRLSKPKLLIDQQLSFANIFQGSSSQSPQKSSRTQNAQKNESRLELVTTTNTITMNILIGNQYELSSNNTTARYNQNGNNNVIYLKNQEQNDQNHMINSKRSSIPSEDSHRLPTINSNHARPLSHYELKREEPSSDSLSELNKKQKMRDSNYNGQFTQNNINQTTNNSNINTLYQVQSKDELDNASPLEIVSKENNLILYQSSKNDEKLLPRQTTNKTFNSFQQSPSFTGTSRKLDTNVNGLKFNYNEYYTEEDHSSQIKENKDKIFLTYQNEQSKSKSRENTDDVEKINDNSSSSSDIYLSQNTDLVCDGNITEVKVIDGCKLQNYRRNILCKVNQEDTIREAQTNNAQSQKQSVELKSSSEQDISKAVEKKLETYLKENNDDEVEDLEGGVRLSEFQVKSEQDKTFGKNSLGDLFDKIKLETPEIFFQNCPKCQSKQHEFQLKLSKIGPEGVKPRDKYCQVCLMKAELTEVRLADSNQKINI